MAVFGTPWVIAAQLLWRTWWRGAGAGLAVLDGPAQLLAVATATLPADGATGGGHDGRAGPGSGPRGAATWYVAEHPLTHQGYPPTISATLPPVTAVVLAVVLAGCLWLALRPPRWLLPDRPARRFGVGMAHRPGRAADRGRLAGRGAALVPAGRRAAPGWGGRGRDGRQPGRCDLVDADRRGAVGAAHRRARRGVGSAPARRRRAREHADPALSGR
jgi:hypothetical protein